ncbi:hypothetical protein C0Q70_06330 [Pomacea canaliculata]|uniref:Microtubule-associated protein Jupiter n=1 Tax=Pomacea canaliculata TaxID=400727 RepID=A0A2T7PNQ2_POMCA|nr:hypothetical protein C0Q70_06330 [Pomacea canaliculata]
MTTTSTFSGLNEDAKPTSRVLKPPGGGSSNIFGAEASASAAKPKAGTKKPTDSGVFGKTDTGHGSDRDNSAGRNRTARDGDDSFNRLFGDPGSSPVSAKSTEQQRKGGDTHFNIFGDDISAQGEGFLCTTPGHSSGRYSGKGRGSYNPITGADYKDLVPTHHALNVKEPPKPQKEQPPLPYSDGEFQVKEGKAQNVHTSSRVTNPPGGKTHKLW